MLSRFYSKQLSVNYVRGLYPRNISVPKRFIRCRRSAATIGFFSQFKYLTLFPRNRERAKEIALDSFIFLLILIAIISRFNFKSAVKNKISEQIIDLNINLWRNNPCPLNLFKVCLCFCFIHGLFQIVIPPKLIDIR